MDADVARPRFEELLCGGVAVQDDFIPPRRVRELVRCAERRRDRGGFAAAGIGAGQGRRLREDIRGDLTSWIEGPLWAAERSLLTDFERLRLELNGDGLLGLFDLELHYAWYGPGAGYARHVDQPRGGAHRWVTLVLYLNEAWTPLSGGELRIFAADRVRDIEPVAGRLVCFLTAGREHEVLTTRSDRLSITGWFRRRC